MEHTLGREQRTRWMKLGYPRLVNYRHNPIITDAEAVLLAKWDMIIVDMDTPNVSPRAIPLIREYNPDITSCLEDGDRRRSAG
jgi:hypothetical protein